MSVAWVKPPQNPVPVRVLQSYFFQSARHFLKSSLTFSPSLLHSIFIFFCFCMQGHSTLHDALRRRREMSRESTNKEGESSGGGRHVMSRMSLFACLFNPVHPEQGALQVTAKRCPLLSLKPLTPVHPLWREKQR